jgi:hypothetical protein
MISQVSFGQSEKEPQKEKCKGGISPNNTGADW